MSSNWEKLELILIGIIVLLLIRVGCNQTSIREYESVNAALQDSLHHTVNKLGQEVASRKVFQSSAAFFQRQLRASDDSAIQRLIAAIDKSTISASQIRTATAGIDSISSVMASGDSCNPVYQGSFRSRWDSISVTASRNRITFGYEVYNEFAIEQSLKSRGWFRQPDLLVSVTNLNPHTRTIDLQSFHVNYPKRRFGIGPAIGVGFGGSLSPAPIIGVVASYSIIQF